MGKSQFYRSTTVEALTNETVKLIGFTDTTTIPAGQTLTVNFYADTGHIAEIVGMNVTFDNDPNATSGQRNLALTQANSAIGLCIGSSNYNTKLEFRNYEYKYQDITTEPENYNMVHVLKSVKFDEVNGIALLFENLTNLDYTLGRNIRLYIKQTKII